MPSFTAPRTATSSARPAKPTDRATVGLQRAGPAGAGIAVRGARVRRAPATTMLAEATREAAAVNRRAERLVGARVPEPGGQAVGVAREVVAPLHAPRVRGWVLSCGAGTAIRVPPAVATLLGECLVAGRKIAVAGPGTIGHPGRALDAGRIGESLGSLCLAPRAPERTQ